MRNGWNMNREVMIWDRTLNDWREADTYDHRNVVPNAPEDCEIRLVLRQYGTVFNSWVIWEPFGAFHDAFTPRFRQNLAVTQGITIGDDEPSWSDWIDYATALTMQARDSTTQMEV